jgi:hypothetical protein
LSENLMRKDDDSADLGPTGRFRLIKKEATKVWN